MSQQTRMRDKVRTFIPRHRVRGCPAALCCLLGTDGEVELRPWLSGCSLVSPAAAAGMEQHPEQGAQGG